MLKRAHWIGVAGVALIAPLAGVLYGGCQGTCQLNSECPSGSFCFLGPGQCGQAVPLGFCTEISDVCSQGVSTVCGCDNNTYINACIASQHGQSTLTSTACVARPCGGATDKCPSGQVCQFAMIGTCEGQGAMGTCIGAPTMCEDILQPVCGCDGKTYQSICEMQKAGTSEFAATACTCTDNSQCSADQFCNYAGGTAVGAGCLSGAPMGTCSPRPTTCTNDVQLVCGCDGNTFQNGCFASMAGVNVAFQSACTAGMLPDAGADGGDAGDGG